MIEKKNNITIQMAEDETGLGEYSITGANGRKIYFDGYDPINRIVYEFNGCKYHECPICGYGLNSGEKYKKTLEREKYILTCGYKLFRIWEHEYWDYIKGKTISYGKFITIEELNVLLKLCI